MLSGAAVDVANPTKTQEATASSSGMWHAKYNIGSSHAISDIFTMLYGRYWSLREAKRAGNNGKWMLVVDEQNIDSLIFDTLPMAVDAIPSNASNVIFVCIGRESAKDIFWRDFNKIKQQAPPEKTFAKLVKSCDITNPIVTYHTTEANAIDSMRAEDLLPGASYIYGLSLMNANNGFDCFES